LPEEGSFDASRMDRRRSNGSAQQPMQIGGSPLVEPNDGTPIRAGKVGRRSSRIAEQSAQVEGSQAVAARGCDASESWRSAAGVAGGCNNRLSRPPAPPEANLPACAGRCVLWLRRLQEPSTCVDCSQLRLDRRPTSPARIGVRSFSSTGGKPPIFTGGYALPIDRRRSIRLASNDPSPS